MLRIGPFRDNVVRLRRRHGRPAKGVGTLLFLLREMLHRPQFENERTFQRIIQPELLSQYSICSIYLTMARYYFHVRDRSGISLDPEGVLLPDFAAARDYAIAGARSLICEEISRGVLDLGGSIQIADEHGQTIFILSFDEAVSHPED